MKTVLICVFAFFSFLFSTAQNTRAFSGFGNLKTNVHQSTNFMNLGNANNYNTTKYTFGKSTGFYTYSNNYFPSVLSQQVTPNVSIGLDTNIACLYPTTPIMLDIGIGDTPYRFTTTEIVISSVLHVFEILSYF